MVKKDQMKENKTMPENGWASIDDFATLFQYLWYRDFPIDQIASGARRADWTIHIGIVIRNVADFMGFVTRFEHGSRKDAILRSTKGDEIAIEWEWDDVSGNRLNELGKLKEHKAWSKSGDSNNTLKYAVLITYTHATSETIQTVYDKVSKEWSEATWPLLLILVQAEETKELSSRRKFKNITMSVFDKDIRQELRSCPAVPRMIPGTRWSYQQ